MKLNIQKLQVGGGLYTTATVNPFFQSQTAEMPSGGNNSGGVAGLIPEKLMMKLYENGIPTDVRKFMGMLASFENSIALGGDIGKGDLYGLMAQANEIIKQSKYLDEAEKITKENGSFDEFAVDENGQLFVWGGKGKIKKVSASEFKYGEMQPLTVGQLIDYRKYAPLGADRYDYTSAIRNNIGLEKINSYIQDIVSKIGSTDTVDEAYQSLAGVVQADLLKRPTAQQQEGIKELYNLVQKLGPDALFKVKEEYKSKNIESGFEYLISMIPNNIKTQLIARNVAHGGKFENSTQYVANILFNVLNANNDRKIVHTVDYDASINKAAGTSAGQNESKKTFYQTPLEQFFDGDLNVMDIKFSDNLGGRNFYGMSLKGNRLPQITTDRGEEVSNLPMSIALNTGIAKYLDKDKVWVGDQKMPIEFLNNVAYANDACAAVYMPIDEEGNIDWRGFHAFTQAEEQIKKNHITDPKTKNQIHAAHHSYAMYDQDNNLIETDRVGKFFLAYGYTIDDHIDDNNSMVEELQDDKEDYADQLIKSIYNKNTSKKFGIKGIDSKQFWDDIYKVPIFIKINQFASGDAYRYAGHGSLMNPMTLQQDMVQELMNREVAPENRINASGALLNQE